MVDSLTNFNDIFANLAESSYNGRPNLFPIEGLKPSQKKDLDSGKSVEFDFSKDATVSHKVDGKWVTETTKGGINLPNNGKVYLQPDKSGSLTNEQEGYNAYFVTDKPSVKDSKETYFVNRGSDSYENLHDLWTDWIKNDIPFAVASTHIPQAKFATVAMHEKIKELPDGVEMNLSYMRNTA